MPFSVADFQGVMFFGAVGVAGHSYELVRLIDLEVGQQVQLFGLLNFLRGKIRHCYRASRFAFAFSA